MAEFALRQVQAGDYEAIYGQPLRHSIKGVVATKDGKPMGIAGVAYVDGQVTAFSRALPGLPKSWIWRGAKMALRMIKEMNCPVLAVADPDIPTAPAFLERIGFEHVTTNSQGKVYRWQR